MNWPSDSMLFAYVAKVTATFALGLALSRLFKHHLRLRQIVWALCFVVPVWLLLPLPRLSLPILERPTKPAIPTPHVYEIAPSFSTFSSERILDPPPSWVFLALIASAVLGLVVLTLRWIGTIRLVQGAEQVVDEALVAMMYELGQQHCLTDVPMLKTSDTLDSPCVWGILQPVIVVPTSFGSLGQDEWRLVLQHEIVHLKQRDPLRLLFYSLVQATMWWNPLLWFGLQDALLTQEQAIDSRIGKSKSYANLLSRTVVTASPGPRLRFLGKGHLLTRLRTLTDPETPETKPWQIAALLAFVPLILPFKMVAAYEPDLKQIGFEEMVFQSDRTGVGRLWRSTSDGRGPLPMPDHFIGVGVPTISRDGEWVTYTRLNNDKEDIFISRVDGTDELQCVSGPERDVQGVWSPDGNNLVYCTMATGNWEIGLYDLKTRQNRFLTKDGKRNLEPSWHPNGERIIFSSHRSGSQNIWSMNVDGSGLIQITARGAEDTAAKYSRDGRKVLFASSRRGKYDVLLLDLPTSSVRVLSPMTLADAGEPRFVEGDAVVVMSANTGTERPIARFDLRTGEFDMLRSTGANFWPTTR